jgi:hypothetical protein
LKCIEIEISRCIFWILVILVQICNPLESQAAQTASQEIIDLIGSEGWSVIEEGGVARVARVKSKLSYFQDLSRLRMTQSWISATNIFEFNIIQHNSTLLVTSVDSRLWQCNPEVEMSSKRVTAQDGRVDGRSFETSETSEQTSYLEDLGRSKT